MILMIRDQAVEQVLRGLTLSKARSQAAATVTAQLLTDAADHYLPGLTVAVGDPSAFWRTTGPPSFPGPSRRCAAPGRR